MKFKEIKPGMVIHCPKEEDARALLEHLKSLGYVWYDKFDLNYLKPPSGWGVHGSDTCFEIGLKSKVIKWGRLQSWQERHRYKITEFSDLIESDDSSMTAKEIICWLKDNKHSGGCADVFGSNSMEYIFSSWSGGTIVEAITAYEAAKKAPKPVEVEWVDVCRIIQIQDNGVKKCVYEEVLPDNDGCIEYGHAENILKKYISEHEGRYIAVNESVCRVKEDK